jgi:HTH domain
MGGPRRGGSCPACRVSKVISVVDFVTWRRQFFLIKESIEIVAQALGVTRYTIYNYLGEIGEIPTPS